MILLSGGCLSIMVGKSFQNKLTPQTRYFENSINVSFAFSVVLSTFGFSAYWFGTHAGHEFLDTKLMHDHDDNIQCWSMGPGIWLVQKI